MPSIVLSVCISLVLIPSGRVVAQTTQNQPPDHDHRVTGPLGARQLAVKPFTTLPAGILVLRLETFSTTEAAQRAATPISAVAEAAGKVWLFTLGPRDERSQGGTFVAEIGPVPPVPPAAGYVLEVLEGEHGPDVKAEVARAVHIHPGPEIFYLLAGEQCLETPNGATRARSGEGMVAPANTPMQLNIIGSSKLDAFFAVVHDSQKPRAAPSDWQPKGTCQK
jgi:mannose-6-phosphate isomerase-like protein (cupin superfamily)